MGCYMLDDRGREPLAGATNRVVAPAMERAEKGTLTSPNPTVVRLAHRSPPRIRGSAAPGSDQPSDNLELAGLLFSSTLAPRARAGFDGILELENSTCTAFPSMPRLAGEDGGRLVPARRHRTLLTTAAPGDARGGRRPNPTRCHVGEEDTLPRG